MIDRVPIRRLRVLLGVLLALLPARSGRAQQVTIYRDVYGVPSVVAERLPDAMYGLGYAMAQDNAEQMARNFKQARGRRAEVDGQSALLTDGFLRALGFEERAAAAGPRLPTEPALLIRRFCDGANRSLAEQKSRLPDWIEPFTPVDVLSLAQLGQAAFPLEEIAGALLPGAGSNQFAVAPRRSASGHAILSIDPHLLWSGPLLWYEYSVYSRAFNFHGVTLAGLPFGTMGHTDHVAWSMTNNNPRLYDFLTVTVNPANHKQYSHHGVWRDFEEVPAEMRYRSDGKLKTLRQTLTRTAWGPMVPFRSQAVRLAVPEIPVMLEQSLRMARARTAAEFRRALTARGLSMWNIVYADTAGHIGYQYNANLPKRYASIDWTKPVAGSDPATAWSGAWSLDELPHAEDPPSGLLINCNTAPWLTTLGGEIPSRGWPAYVSSYGTTTRYERLAALLTADSHVTLDAAKAYATDTLVPYARPATTALADAVRGSARKEVPPSAPRSAAAGAAEDAGTASAGRAVASPASAERVATGVGRRGGFAMLKASVHSERVAHRVAGRAAGPRVTAAILDREKGGSNAARERGAEIRDGLKVLEAWNGRADVGARGCALYLYWMRADRNMAALARKAAGREPWNDAEKSAAVAAFESACRDLVTQHGRLDPPWGDVHLSERGIRTAPVSGLGYFAPGDKTATVTPNFGPFRDGRIVCTGGSSFRMIVHLDPKGVRSWSALPYGNSQDPANPHFADQQAMFGRGEYKDTLYGLARIRKVAISKTTLRTGQGPDSR